MGNGADRLDPHYHRIGGVAALIGNHLQFDARRGTSQQGAAELVQGIKPASLDRHKIGDRIVAGSVANSYRLGPVIANPETRVGSDRAVMDNGWIALTALGMDVTAFDTQASLTTRAFDVRG